LKLVVSRVRLIVDLDFATALEVGAVKSTRFFSAICFERGFIEGEKVAPSIAFATTFSYKTQRYLKFNYKTD
jgi:hypothetical protein